MSRQGVGADTTRGAINGGRTRSSAKAAPHIALATPNPKTAAQPPPLRKLAPGEPRYHSHWRPKPAGAWYDEQAADRAVEFFPDYCVLTKKEWAGRPFELEQWQADWIVRPAFGWRRADGTRLYRRVIIWIPRKNGKTELMAGVSHLCLLGDAVQGAECYSIASHGDQAQIVFEAASNMVKYSDALSDYYDVFTSSLFCRQTHGVFKPLTGKPRGKHGLGAVYLLGDEVHEWANDTLYTYVRNSMASAREPMEWLISTFGVDSGYGPELWSESLGICEGTFDDDRTLVVAWCAPQDAKVEIDIQDPAVWAEANPNLGVSVQREYLREYALECSQSAKKENEFKAYHLNIWVGAAERWLEPAAWASCNAGGPERWLEMEAELEGRECWAGLDIASTQDFNALTLLFPPVREGERWKALWRYWWPERRMREAARRTRIPFESWHAKGAFYTTPGNAADHEQIKDDILDDCARFRVLGMGVDLFNAHSIMTALEPEGVPIQAVRFGMMSASQPSKQLEKWVLDGELDHGGQPVSRWMAANTAIERDRHENYMPSKKGSTNKIDGIVSLIMAIGMSMTAEVEPESYLAHDPLIVLR